MFFITTVVTVLHMMKEKNTLNKLRIKEREARRNLIMDAAERVFAIKPLDKVNMSEIAEEAGIATSSIYTYFPNQETLFIETALRDANALIEGLKSIIEKNGELQIEEIIDAFIDYFTGHDAYFRMMAHFMLYGNFNLESVQKINSIMRQMFDLFDTVFINTSFRGNTRMLSHYFFAALNGILISFRKYPGRSEAEVISHMKRLGKILADLLKNHPA
jgi:AcrR family transcriptional regulator